MPRLADVTNVKVGGVQADKIYSGPVLVWGSEPEPILSSASHLWLLSNKVGPVIPDVGLTGTVNVNASTHLWDGSGPITLDANDWTMIVSPTADGYDRDTFTIQNWSADETKYIWVYNFGTSLRMAALTNTGYRVGDATGSAVNPLVHYPVYIKREGTNLKWGYVGVGNEGVLSVGGGSFGTANYAQSAPYFLLPLNAFPSTPNVAGAAIWIGQALTLSEIQEAALQLSA